MRRGKQTGESEFEFPVFPISPILESYGGVPAVEGLGWKPYRCPFHDDRDASGSVNTQKQVYNCHAADCPKGNAVQVLMQYERMDYASAVERAAEISGASDTYVRRESGRRGRMAGGSRNRSGARSFKRTWRSE